MKAALIALVLVTMAYATVTSPDPPRRPLGLTGAHKQTSPKGKWYMAQNGHAVYCLGPVVTLPSPDHGITRVATFCRGTTPMVELKD